VEGKGRIYGGRGDPDRKIKMPIFTKIWKVIPVTFSGLYIMNKIYNLKLYKKLKLKEKFIFSQSFEKKKKYK